MTHFRGEINHESSIDDLKRALKPLHEAVSGLKKKTANEMAGPCPWCGGSDRFVVFLDSGRFLCRGCTTKGGDVVDFHMRQEGTDFKGLCDKYIDRQDTPKGPKTETGRRVHVFADAEGNPIYRKTIRSYSDRTKDAFFERHEAGQWHKGLGGIKQTLYGLPGLKTPGTVFMSESEKDADRLTELGLVASSFGGAENWRAEYAGILAGREVVILAHNDEPGRKAAEKAARGLAAYECKVKIIPGETWGPSRGADVADWLQAGHTREELESLVENAPSCAPGADASPTIAEDEPSPLDGWTPKAWPELDPRALYGLAGQTVDLACRHSEADPAAVLATFLSWFGCEIGYYPGLKIGEAFHSARLFVAIVGNSSKARKGTSAAPIRTIRGHLAGDADQVIGSKNMRVVAATSPGPLSSGEGLIYAVRDEVKKWVEPKKNRDGEISEGYWVTSDPGIEDKRLHVIDEEFASALASMRREGTTLSTIMRGAWDHGHLAPLTKTSHTKATHAHLCITTHITIEELRAKLEDVEAFNGFGNRFLWACARRQRLVSRPVCMDETELAILCREIARRLDTLAGQRLASFTDATWGMWKDVYPMLTRERDGFAGAMIQRAEAQVVRLAMVYAFTDGSISIEPRHLEAALAFWQYCEDSAMYIFGGRAADALTQKIIDLLKEGPLTATGISNGLQHNIKAERIQDTLDALVARRKVTSIREKTPGRPRIVFKLSDSTPYEKNELNELSPEGVDLNSFNSFNSFNSLARQGEKEVHKPKSDRPAWYRPDEATEERRAIMAEEGAV